MQAALQNVQSHALFDQANWCFRVMRDCTDPELTAELGYMGSTLLNMAQGKLMGGDTRPKAMVAAFG